MATTSPPDEKELLASYLAERDVPCPRCGYNLRTLQSRRCPECGEELTLRVGLVYPKLAALMTGLIGLSAGAGLNGLLLVYMAIQMVRHPYWRQLVYPFGAYNGAGFVVEGGLVILWLICWRRLHRRPAAERWFLAAGAWALTTINITIFSFTLR